MSKIDPAVIGSSRKICDMLPSLFPSILFHHILPLFILRKNSEGALRTRGIQDMVIFSVCVTLLTWPTYVSNVFGVGRGLKTYKNGLSMGVTIGGDAEKVARTLIC